LGLINNWGSRDRSKSRGCSKGGWLGSRDRSKSWGRRKVGRMGSRGRKAVGGSESVQRVQEGGHTKEEGAEGTEMKAHKGGGRRGHRKEGAERRIGCSARCPSLSTERRRAQRAQKGGCRKEDGMLCAVSFLEHRKEEGAEGTERRVQKGGWDALRGVLP